MCNNGGIELSPTPGHPSPRRDLNAAQRVLASPVGEVLARRWLDWLILQSLKRLFFPFSRLWAAARAANGEVDQFAAAAPLTREIRYRSKLRRALKIFERERANTNSVEFFWRENFFGPNDVPENTSSRSKKPGCMPAAGTTPPGGISPTCVIGWPRRSFPTL